MATRSVRRCGCSPACDATTARYFAPGHDARMVTRLTMLVATGELDLEQAARFAHQAGGTRALLTKLVDRVAKLQVRWTRVTAVTVMCEYDTLAVQYYAVRAERGLAPWVLHRTDRIGDEPAFLPERNEGDRAFYTIGEAVAWQAARQSRTTSPWRVWGAIGFGRLIPTEIDTWEWLK